MFALRASESNGTSTCLIEKMIPSAGSLYLKDAALLSAARAWVPASDRLVVLAPLPECQIGYRFRVQPDEVASAQAPRPRSCDHRGVVGAQ